MISTLRVACFCLVFAAALHGTAAQDDDPAAALKDMGLKLAGENVVLLEESAVGKQLGEVPKLRKKLIEAGKARAFAERRVLEKGVYIEQLTEQRRQLNARLANVDNVFDNNQLVVAINELTDQINALTKSEELEDQAKQARQNSNQLREEFVDHLLTLRKAHNAVVESYADLQSDADLAALMSALQKDKPLKLGPSRTFLSYDEKIQKIEDTVLSDTIPLQQDGGVWSASVVVNGGEAQDFIVDTGASLMCLPAAMAKKLKAEPTSQSPMLLLSLADGRTITARQVILASVRVGKFTLENVECAVLPETAVNASALLGQSFLGKFKFELNGDAGELVMTRVEGEDGAAPARTRGAAARSRGKASSKDDVDEDSKDAADDDKAAPTPEDKPDDGADDDDPAATAARPGEAPTPAEAAGK